MSKKFEKKLQGTINPTLECPKWVKEVEQSKLDSSFRNEYTGTEYTKVMQHMHETSAHIFKDQEKQKLKEECLKCNKLHSCQKYVKEFLADNKTIKICAHTISYYFQDSDMEIDESSIEHIKECLCDNQVEGELNTTNSLEEAVRGWWHIERE
jgi:hypothetical protein